MARTVLIDSDIVAYQEAAGGELKVDWDGDGNVDQIPPSFEHVCEKVDRVIAKVAGHLKADRIIVCLSCAREDNFRKDFYPAYKENRAGAIKPVHLMAAKEYMAREYETFQRPRLEADDVMGILATHPKLVKGERVIVSEDKDMQTVPGLLFNPRKDTRPRTVSPTAAVHFHMFQTLMGDPTDGYPGCPGIGKTKAAEILAGIEDPVVMWRTIVMVYVARLRKVRKDPALPVEDCEDAAIVQARCARILQWTDYDYTRKEPILWTPPTLP